MQGMGINSHPGSTYGPIQDMDMGQQHFEDMPPAPPQDNNQVSQEDASLILILIVFVAGCCLVRHRPLSISRLVRTMSWWMTHYPARTQTSKTEICWHEVLLFISTCPGILYVVMLFSAVQIEFFLKENSKFVADVEWLATFLFGILCQTNLTFKQW